MKISALILIWPFLFLVQFAAVVYGDNQLSDEDKRWLEQDVAPLITPEEIELFRDIDSKDRELFKRIFWARRDPNPSTRENEFRKAFEASVEIADRQLAAPGRKGSTTDMGRVFVMLGNPDRHDQENEQSDTESRESDLPPVEPVNEEETEPNPQAFATEGFDDLGESDDLPTVAWIYSPNESLGFPDGLTIRFRSIPNFGNRMIRTAEIEQVLEKVKTIYISNPDLTYTRDGEGRLSYSGGDIPLETSSKQILNALRNTRVTSSELSVDTTLAFFRSTEGKVYIPILFELDDAPDALAVTVFGSMENTHGEPVQQFEEQTALIPGPDGRAQYEIPAQAPPGRYKLYVGIQDDESGAVGTQILDLDVPDFSSGSLVLSSVVVYREGRKTRVPAGTPGHAFQFGSVKFQPAHTFTQQDTLGFFFFAYGFGLDADGKPDITGRYTFYKDGQPTGQTEPEPLLVEANQAMGNAEIPLSAFEAGNYRMEVTVMDRVAGQVTIKDVVFEISP